MINHVFIYSFSLFQVTVPKDLVALMSAVGTGSSIDPNNPEKKIYTFTQKVLYVIIVINNVKLIRNLLTVSDGLFSQVVIPSYLIALVVGALVSQ